MLVAGQLRLTLSYGLTLGDDYEQMPFVLFVITMVCGAVGELLSYLLWPQRSSKRRGLLALFIGQSLTIGLILVFMPLVSGLQLVYFAVIASLIALITIVWSGGRTPRENLSTYIAQLWRYRVLLRIWVKYNVEARYSQTLLGIMWIVLLPLSQALVFAFVFSQILRASSGSLPFLVFFLSGIVPYTLFNQGILNGTSALLGQMGIINQVYFPREIIIFVRLGEAFVDFTFSFLVLLLISLLNGIFPTLNFIWVIPILLIQLLLILGFMLFISYLSVYIRDIPQLVAVVLQILFYLTPVLYQMDRVPEEYHFLLLLNPLTPLIQAFRDVTVLGQAPQLATLYYPSIMAGILVFSGYMFFKRNEQRLTDYV